MHLGLYSDSMLLVFDFFNLVNIIFDGILMNLFLFIMRHMNQFHNCHFKKNLDYPYRDLLNF